MADIRVDELTQETASTLDGTERFVMFDTQEGKSASLDVIAEYLANELGTNDVITNAQIDALFE